MAEVHEPMSNGAAPEFTNGVDHHLGLDDPIMDPAANGFPEDPVADVPGFEEVADFTGDTFGLTAEPFEPANDEVADAPVEEANTPLTSFYMVRIPRPNVDDTLVKKLQEKFQTVVNDVKKKQERLRDRRKELSDVRRELAEARSLKFSAQPEYSEKGNGFKGLQHQKGEILAHIREIRDNVKGLECKSEEELDAKIRQTEESIQYNNLTLREEKQAVAQISKLKGQREAVRRYEAQASMLAELESQLKGIKSQIEETQGEFGVLKSERDQADKVFKDIDAKYKKKDAECKAIEEEVKEAMQLKDEAMAVLNKARAETDRLMKDYWDYKRFSTIVRDMVVQGRAEEAAAMAAQQVEEAMERLSTDSTFRAEYFKLWESQRRYQVSALLPGSAPVASTSAPAATAAKGGPAAKGGAAVAKPRAPPPKPQGAAKAADLIAAALQAASQQAQADRTRNAAAAPANADDDDEDEEDEEPAPKASGKAFEPSALAKAAAVPAVAARGGADSVFAHKVVVPTIPQDQFVVPSALVAREEAKDNSSKQEKDRIREENKAKQEEAEMRKRKRQEAADKKRQLALEAARKAGEDRKKGKLDVKAAAQTPDPADSGADVTGVDTATSAAENTDNDAEPIARLPQRPAAGGRQRGVSRRTPAAADPDSDAGLRSARKRPVRTEKNKLKKFWKQYGGFVVAGIVTVLILIMALLYVFAMKH